MKVYISPSLQEHNAYVNGGTEEQWMNKVADVVVPLLQSSHLEVYRNKPTMTLQQAVADSNNRDVDVHFAIHSNAGGGRGGEVLYLSSKGQKLASCVYKYLEPLTPTADRGVKQDPHLYELNQTKAVAALVEVMFHDNIDDAKFIETHIQELGECIAHGICDYLGVDFIKKSLAPKYSGTLIKYGPDKYSTSVKLIQQELGIAADGYFGTITLEAVKQFQKSHGLTVDGIVGPQTWNKLFN